MKKKTSITLEPSTLRDVDELAGEAGNRSQIIERAVLEYLERHRRALREARDQEILDRCADELSAEVEEVLSYQAEP